MTAHERALELAAAAIDFPLTPAERRELDEHLAMCATCRRDVAGLRGDAAAVLTPVAPLSAERSQAVLARALRRRRGGPPLRLLAIAALLALGTGAALAAGSQLLDDAPTETPPVVVRPSEAPTPTAQPTTSPPSSPSTPAPTDTPTAPPGRPTAEPTPSATSRPPVTGGPVRADAQVVGTGIGIAPAPDGGAFVTVPADAETALFRLAPDGVIAPGWPFILPSTTCAPPLAAEDGSVRVLCLGEGNDQGLAETLRAYAIDGSGHALPGWPLDAPCCVETVHQPGLDIRMDGTRLLYAAAQQVAPVKQLVSIHADGRVEAGSEVPDPGGAVANVLGPGGIAYAVRVVGGEGTAGGTEAAAFDAGGVVEGWPVHLGDWSSPPAFLPDGRIAFATVEDGATRLRVLAADGTESSGVDLPFEPTIPWSGAGDVLFAPMLVAPDGSLRISSNNHEVWAVDPVGGVMEGWPWKPATLFQQQGICAPDETGCGQSDVRQGIGPEGQVIVAVEATDTGGALVAVNADGTVREGWPVTLNTVGSSFWSVATAGSGVTYALAIEPEGNAGFSGTVLRLEPDSTVSWVTTLVEP